MMNEYGSTIILDNLASLGDSIHVAVARNDIDQVEKYLRSSDCINQSKFGYTPVQIALVLGHDDISHLFLTNPKLDRTFMWNLHGHISVQWSSVHPYLFYGFY